MKNKRRSTSYSEDMNKLLAIMELDKKLPAPKMKPGESTFPEISLKKYREAFVSKKLERTFEHLAKLTTV